jgi:hypothetical protein
VVDSKAVAQDCIRYLRDQRVGTCTFLPLDNLVAQPLPERLRSFGSRYKPCVDLLESAEQYKVQYSAIAPTQFLGEIRINPFFGLHCCFPFYRACTRFHEENTLFRALSKSYK